METEKRLEKTAGRRRENGRECAGCRFAVPVYMGDGEELLTACVYILRTGKKRPCPPGRECTVREPAGGDGAADTQRRMIGLDVRARSGANAG